MATIKHIGAMTEGIEISAPISGYQDFLAELKKQELEEIRKVFSGEKSIILKAGVEAPAVELIPVPLSAPIVKASETGENWEQFCERFGVLYGNGGQATFKFSASTTISREFFDAYGAQATINAIRRDCFRSLMEAMLKIEGQSIN